MTRYQVSLSRLLGAIAWFSAAGGAYAAWSRAQADLSIDDAWLFIAMMLLLAAGIGALLGRTLVAVVVAAALIGLLAIVVAARAN